MATLFTRIIDGELPGRFVWADDACVGFLTIAPIATGHTLVVPRLEVDRFTDADNSLLAHLAQIAATIGRAQETAWPGTRATVMIAGFEVPHLHVHVVPVHSERQLSFGNADPGVSSDELDKAATSLREALIEAGYGDRVQP